jgi:hypothetical protein
MRRIPCVRACVRGAGGARGGRSAACCAQSTHTTLSAPTRPPTHARTHALPPALLPTPTHARTHWATVHSAQCTMHNAQCTMHNAQCTFTVGAWVRRRQESRRAPREAGAGTRRPCICAPSRCWRSCRRQPRRPSPRCQTCCSARGTMASWGGRGSGAACGSVRSPCIA